MAKEWFIQEYEDKKYLHNKGLVLKEFPKGSNDHDHCELCWARFSNFSGDHHTGHYEIDSNSWICIDCYQELHVLFGWYIIEEK